MKKILCVSMVLSMVAMMTACGSKKGDNTPDQVPSGGDTTVNPPSDNQGTNPPGQQDPTPNPVPTGTGTNPPPPPPANLASCIADCEKQFPVAAQQNKDLDNKCFLGGACEPVCDNLGSSGKLFPPNAVDGGAACDLSTSWEVRTESAECSTCIATNVVCCGIWASIFGSVAGQNLAECSNACYAKFPSK